MIEGLFKMMLLIIVLLMENYTRQNLIVTRYNTVSEPTTLQNCSSQKLFFQSSQLETQFLRLTII